MRAYRGGSNPALVQQFTPSFSYVGSTSLPLYGCYDLLAYADALQVSVGQFLDSESPAEVQNGLWVVEMYRGAAASRVPGVLTPMTANAETMMSLGPPIGRYFGPQAGQTLPVLPWADHIRFTVIMRPVLPLPFPLTSAQISVVSIGYRS
jgi:hypothetical protein